MIEFELVAGNVTQVTADVLAVPCYQGPEFGPGAAAVDAALGIDLASILASHGFRGETGDLFSTLALGKLAAREVLFVGVGPQAQAGPGSVRHAAMLAAPRLTWARTVAATLAQAGGAAIGPSSAAFAEGLLLGAYHYYRYRTGARRPAIERVIVLTDDAGRAAADAGIKHGRLLADLANWVRDLVNASPSDVTPDYLAGQASDLAVQFGLTRRIMTVPDLEAGGFGGILGVGQGSKNEPRLAELSYRGGAPDGPVLGLTGKGITFDSGGISLKRTAEIEYMKSDMAGAATVMAVVRGAAELGLPVNIDAVLPFAENMPGGAAQRPGDVLVHRGGKTSEIRDTDSEGRLIVADALSYLSERGPAALVDVATLTDAAGLGESLWAVLGSDEPMIRELIEAGLAAGDPGWQLPLPRSYRRHLDSVVADVRNTPSAGADTTVMAATYLREFTGGLPWMHIDNGSTAYLERPFDGWPEGATGSPTRALLTWVQAWAE